MMGMVKVLLVLALVIYKYTRMNEKLLFGSPTPPKLHGAMSEVTLNIEESTTTAAAVVAEDQPLNPTLAPTSAAAVVVPDEDTISDLGAPPSSSDHVGATEENPLKPPDPDDDKGGGGGKATTIVHHQPHNPYAQYYPCCPQSIIPSTKPKFIFFTVTCALSFLCAILLSVCFFYPETIFGVPSDVIQQHANSASGKMIHHPHQNRKTFMKVGGGAAASNINTGGGIGAGNGLPVSRRVLSTGQSGDGGLLDDNEGSSSINGDDEDLYDDSGGGGGYLGGVGVGGSGPGFHLYPRQLSTHKPIVAFPDLIEASNFSSIVQSRLLHFDLKGAPPTVSFMKEVMNLAKDAGITGILIEWEDTFPWKGRLANTTMANGAGYSESQVEEIIEYAEKELNLDVIPLIQTFGHVEYILKGQDFFRLREDPNDPQAFCPSLPETLEVIEEMIRQIAGFHKSSKFIHIGCDEVFNIGTCPLCSRHSDRMSSLYDPNNEHLFLKHVKHVAQLTIKYDKIPIIWDDMLRTISYEKLNEYQLGSLLEIMVWCYAEDIEKFITSGIWVKYSKLFPTVWVAGSFKGAFGETLQLPPITRHAENTHNWLQLIIRESDSWEVGLGGFVLTGWSRYDHFSVLCELLPVSIPSLVYSALILSVPRLGGGVLIKNRVFVPSAFVEIERNSSEILIEEPAVYNLSDNRRKRRGTKWIPHPQSLKINSAPISTFSGASNYQPWKGKVHHGGGNSAGAGTSHSDLLHISSEFIRILHCGFESSTIQYQILPQLIQESEEAASSSSSSSASPSSALLLSSTSSSLISQCNFHGLSFYRALLKLQSLQTEIWDLDSNLKRDRGWVNAYNQRHNYSSSFRVNELIFRESVPRLKRNVVQISKQLGISLKSLYAPSTVLEWLELNVWNLYGILDGWERVGDKLKMVKVWPRRPLASPDKLVHDLGLLPLGLVDGNKKREEL